MNLLLTGANGQVGFELQRSLAPLGKVHALNHAQCDLSKPDDLRRVMREIQPGIVVNAAAYTAVDKAESERDRAFAINGTAPGILGEEAARLNALVVHYSTDYVFDGKKTAPYVETDPPNPQSVYGASKLAGEQALQASGARYLIFRTSWVYGAHGGNFAKTILRLAGEREELKVVADQFGAPTSAALIADVTAQVVGDYNRRAAGDFPLGLYHLAASGVTQWQEYACAVVQAAYNSGKALKLRMERIHPITTAEYPLPAPRPSNSRLDTSKLVITFGLHMPDWRLGLEHMLKQIL